MKTSWKQITAVFVLGVALGAAVVFRCVPPGFHGRWGNPQKFQHQTMERLTTKLKLTPDQQQKVSVILEEARAKVEALRKESHPKFQEIKNSSREEIKKVLTPDQQKKFDALNAQKEARWGKRYALPR